MFQYVKPIDILDGNLHASALPDGSSIKNYFIGLNPNFIHQTRPVNASIFFSCIPIQCWPNLIVALRQFRINKLVNTHN